MNKPLENMTREELWQLFPIFLVPHNDEWKKWFSEEKKAIEALLPNHKLTISHIGSTAIPDIWAKNIVDILIETENELAMQQISEKLVGNGWLCMNRSEHRISLNKGYTTNGFSKKVFHLHIRLYGDNDEIYFRNYLIAHPEIAKEYETLKLSLWKKFEHDRDGYTDAKSDFIKKYTREACK